MNRVLILGLLLSFAAGASDLDRAQSAYNRTDYQDALGILKASGEASTAAGYELTGKSWYQLGDFKNAIQAFEKAAQLDPTSSRIENWLGRSWGRRAEVSNPLMAPGYASKARQHFERSVFLNPRDQEAVNDLFSYYLEAPGFLGGGMDKATALAERIKSNDPAEYHFALAQIAERRNQYDFAEAHLRSAIEVAPRQVGRVLDLAKFLARRGRYSESENAFQMAAKVAPGSNQVLFAKASSYVETGHNLPEAKKLLQQYLKNPLTADDPPRDEARKLLKRVTD